MENSFPPFFKRAIPMKNSSRFRFQFGQISKLRNFPIFLKIITISFFLTGCVVPSDSQRIHRDLNQQIIQLKSQKTFLSKRVDEARSAIAELQNLVAAQKADMSIMRRDLAPMNQQIKLMREGDLTSLYGQFEVAEKKISDMQKDFAAHEKNFSTTTGKLNTDIQALQEFQQLKGETQGQIQQMQTASQITDQLRQNVEQINTRLQDLEIHQSEFVGKLDSDTQTTTTHLQEVNNGIQSVAKALENVSAKLNTRITNQEQQLNRAVTSFQSVQGSAGAAQANVQHLNDLTETVNQLRGVINTIGTKLGERVDSHEDRLGQLAQRVNRLQGPKSKK